MPFIEVAKYGETTIHVAFVRNESLVEIRSAIAKVLPRSPGLLRLSPDDRVTKMTPPDENPAKETV